MADQVSPLGSLTLGLPMASLGAAAPAPARPLPSGSSSPQPPKQGGLSAAESTQSAKAAMGQLNSHLQQANSSLEYQVDQSTGRTFFQIVDTNTGEVVLQVPSVEMLALARNLRALDKKMGVLVDKEG